MPIPGSRLEDIFDSDVASELSADILPSLGTYLEASNTQQTTGQISHTFAPLEDSRYTDIPCRKAPLILVRPQDQERGYLGMPNLKDARWQVVLIGAYPLIKDTGQFRIDGDTYQIRAVERDGNVITTRILLADMEPFNA